MIHLRFDFKLISKDNEKIMNKQGRYFLSSKFRKFEDKISQVTRKQYRGRLLEGRLRLRMQAFFRTKVHSDTTNLFKGVCDALQGLVYENDRQIKWAECKVIEDKKITEDWFEIFVEKF